MLGFAPEGATGNGPLDGGAGVDENFELRLDIHEFRRLGELVIANLLSLGFFGES